MATTGEVPHEGRHAVTAMPESTEQAPDIPEFDVRRDPDGRWHGTHRPTGNEIIARSWIELEAMACGVRVIASYRRAWSQGQ